MATPTQVDYAALAKQFGGTMKPGKAAPKTKEPSPVAAAPDTPGFWGGVKDYVEAVGHTAGIGKEEAEALRKETEEHPVRSLLRAAAGPAEWLVEGLYGEGKRIAGELQGAHDAPDSTGTASHLISAVPIIGPGLDVATAQAKGLNKPGNTFLDNLKAELNPKTLGTITGTSLQAALALLGGYEGVKNHLAERIKTPGVVVPPKQGLPAAPGAVEPPTIEGAPPEGPGGPAAPAAPQAGGGGGGGGAAIEPEKKPDAARSHATGGALQPQEGVQTQTQAAKPVVLQQYEESLLDHVVRLGEIREAAERELRILNLNPEQATRLVQEVEQQGHAAFERGDINGIVKNALQHLLLEEAVGGGETGVARRALQIQAAEEAEKAPADSRLLDEIVAAGRFGTAPSESAEVPRGTTAPLEAAKPAETAPVVPPAQTPPASVEAATGVSEGFLTDIAKKIGIGKGRKQKEDAGQQSLFPSPEAASGTVVFNQAGVPQPVPVGGFPSGSGYPTEVTAPPVQDAKQKVADTIGGWMKRAAMENMGQGILDEMVANQEKPNEIEKKFWRDTYFKLPGNTQRRFQKMLQAISGMKPGDMIASDPTGKGITADTWMDIADHPQFGNQLGEDAADLEGPERGYAVLMREANRAMANTLAKQTAVPTPQLPINTATPEYRGTPPTLAAEPPESFPEAKKHRQRKRGQEQPRMAVPYQFTGAEDTGGRDKHYEGGGPAEVWRVHTDAGDIDVYVHPGQGQEGAMAEAAKLLGQNLGMGVSADKLFNQGTYKPTPEIQEREKKFKDDYGEAKRTFDPTNPNILMDRGPAAAPAPAPTPATVATRQRPNIVLRETLPGAKEHQAKLYKNATELDNMEKELVAVDQDITKVMANQGQLTGKAPYETIHRLREVLDEKNTHRRAVYNRLKILERERADLEATDPNVGEIRLDADGNPTLFLNRTAMAIITKVSVPGQDGVISGMDLTVPEARTLRKRFDLAKPGNMNEERIWQPVARLLDAAIARSKHTGITLVGKMGSGIQTAISTLREELIHRWQRSRSANGLHETHLSRDAFWSLFNELPNEAHDYLRNSGYERETELFVIEAAAKIMANKWRTMGLTSEQAANWLGRYYDEVTKQHGAQAVTEVKHTFGMARDIQKEWEGRYGSAEPATTAAAAGTTAAASTADTGRLIQGLADRGQEQAPGNAREHAPGEQRRVEGEGFTPEGYFAGQGNAASGVLLVSKKTGKIGMALRSPMRTRRGFQPSNWSTVGGAVAPGMTPEQSALKEVKEETGYDGPIEVIPAHVFTDGSFKYHNFIGLVPDEFPYRPSPGAAAENLKFQWFDPKELKQDMQDNPRQYHPGVHELFNKSSPLIEQHSQKQDWLSAGVQKFAELHGRQFPASSTVEPDSRAMEIADAYEAMKHEPDNPRVKASYDALKHDLDEQWDYAVEQMGVTFEPWNEPGQPYPNSTKMVADVKNNRHLAFYRDVEMSADHPMAAVDPKTGFTYNEKLRAVHDLFGHAMRSNQFGPKGEENAWIDHAHLFSPEAIPALTTETKGQNSWVNFGPNMRNPEGKLLQKGDPGWLSPPERPYSQNKAGLLPERFYYRTDAPVSFVSPNLFPLKDVSEAQRRLNSFIHKQFTTEAKEFARSIGLNIIVEPVLGSWQWGAENALAIRYPVGTSQKMVSYLEAYLGRLGYQFATAQFIPDEAGPDTIHNFWVDSKNADQAKIASTLLSNKVENSTIIPAEDGDGYVVTIIDTGGQLHANIDQIRDELGVTYVGRDAGQASFPGNHESRTEAEREFTRILEEIESDPAYSRHRQTRQDRESRPDYNFLHTLIRQTEEGTGVGPFAPVVEGKQLPHEPFTVATHGSRAPDLTDISPRFWKKGPGTGAEAKRAASHPEYWVPRSYFQWQGTRGEPFYQNQRFQYKAVFNRENLYDFNADPRKLLDQVPDDVRKSGGTNTYYEKAIKDAGYDGYYDSMSGAIAAFNDTPVEKILNGEEGAEPKRFDRNSLKRQIAARKPGGELDRLRWELLDFDPNAHMGQDGAAALIAANGKVAVGDYHHSIKNEVGYGKHKGSSWEQKFLDDGGVRVRAHGGEVNVEFGRHDAETFERMRNVIEAIVSDDFVIDFKPLASGTGTKYWMGDKNSVLAKLDEWEENKAPAPAIHSAAYFRNKWDEEDRPKRFNLERVATAPKSADFKEWFDGSAVVDKRGQPDIMYHATTTDINEFHPYTHFGTRKAAESRNKTLLDFYVKTVRNPARATGANTVPVFLSIKNPLRLPDLASIDGQTGLPIKEARERWKARGKREDEEPYPRGWEGEEAVATTLLENRIINIDEFEEHRSNEDALRLLGEKGYDGIVYKNVVEDPGHDSWIAFRPDQVRPVFGGGQEPKRFNLERAPGQPLSLQEAKEQAEAQRPKGSSVPIMEATLVPKYSVIEDKSGLGEMSTIAGHLDAATRRTLKPLLPQDNTRRRNAMVNRAVQIGRDELKYQLSQENSGANWYKTDIDELMYWMRQLHPELTSQTKALLFRAIAAATSPGHTASMDNIDIAEEAYGLYKSTGLIPLTRPDGTPWGTYGNAPLVTLQAVLKYFGGDEGKAMDWLLAKHTRAELEAVKVTAGFSKTTVKNAIPPGADEDALYGAYVFGQKVGPFFLNLNGISSELTVDRWFMRTWNRWMGTLVGTDGRIQDTEGGKVERRAMLAAIKELEEEFNLETSQVQAALWYYEQGLYGKLGQSGTFGGTYADAGRKVFELRTNPDAEYGGADDRGRKNAPQGRVSGRDGADSRKARGKNSEGEGAGSTGFFGDNTTFDPRELTGEDNLPPLPEEQLHVIRTLRGGGRLLQDGRDKPSYFLRSPALGGRLKSTKIPASVVASLLKQGLVQEGDRLGTITTIVLAPTPKRFALEDLKAEMERRNPKQAQLAQLKRERELAQANRGDAMVQEPEQRKPRGFNCRGGGVIQTISSAGGPKTVVCPACGLVFRRQVGHIDKHNGQPYVRVPRHSTKVSASEQIRNIYGLK